MTGAVVWLTGRPQSGKSTLANAVAARLRARGRACTVLDGDAVRDALVPKLGYGKTDRESFYRTLANLAGLVARQGPCVLVPATSHQRTFRTFAREVAPRFVCVYVAATEEQCRARDEKGLYAAHDDQRIQRLPGRDVVYEVPEDPEIVAAGGRDEDAIQAIVNWVENSAACDETS